MKATYAIAKKELISYLTTPWAWLVFTFMSVVTSFFFIAGLQDFKRVHDDMELMKMTWEQVPPHLHIFKNLTDGVIGNMWNVVFFISIIMTAILSSRLIAEERRQKSFELLMTAPIRTIDIVLGKYIGAAGVVICTLSVTLTYPVILSFFGSTWNPTTSEQASTLEWSTVMLGYLAAVLFGCACMAVGLFVSSLVESQMVAAFITFVVLMVWLAMRAIAPAAEEPLRSVMSYVSPGDQIANLVKGILDLKAIIFFVSVIAVALVLTHRSIESRRWS